MPTIKIQTNKGDITVELFAEDAPKTVENFVTLAKKGFYDGVIFHREAHPMKPQACQAPGEGPGDGCEIGTAGMRPAHLSSNRLTADRR